MGLLRKKKSEKEENISLRKEKTFTSFLKEIFSEFLWNMSNEDSLHREKIEKYEKRKVTAQIQREKWTNIELTFKMESVCTLQPISSMRRASLWTNSFAKILNSGYKAHWNSTSTLPFDRSSHPSSSPSAHREWAMKCALELSQWQRRAQIDRHKHRGTFAQEILQCTMTYRPFLLGTRQWRRNSELQEDALG